MPFRSLQPFVHFLESKGHLKRIKASVDPVLEITEIVNRVARDKGPALLFENVQGSSFPLVVNTLAADERVEWALGRHPEQVGEQLFHFAEALMPPSLKNIWSQRKTVGRALSMRPRYLSNAPARQHCIEPAQLDLLPIAQSWPKDGGKFITFPLVVTQSPVNGKPNMGVYRMQVYNKNQTGMHWQIGKGGGYHYLQAEERNQSLPLTVAVGADPLLMLCGVLPLPEGVSEMAFAGFLRGEATALTRIGSLSVPGEAEFLLDGFVPPHERRREGPYGDHFGHYSLAADFPVFHIDRIWHRDNAIFPISVVGKPPQEDQVMGDAVQKMMLPLIKIIHPEIVDLWAYQEAGFHNLLVISVKQRFEKEAIKSALWALGEGQLSLTKCVVVVDPDVNARRFPDVLRAIARNFDPADDFLLLPGTSQDTLDFTSFTMNLGSKMIIDATKGSKAPRPAPAAAPSLVDALRSFDSRIRNVRVWEGALLVLQVTGAGRDILEKIVDSGPAMDVPLVAAVSPDIPLDDPVLLIWGIFTRFDCARDAFFKQATLQGARPVFSGALFIDATWKQGYPDPLEMTDDVVKTVDRRWKEYGF